MVNCNELSTHYEHIHVILYYELTLASKKVAKSRRIYLRTPVQISLGDRKRTPVAICPELLVVVSSSLIFILLLAVSAVVMAAARYILTPVMLTSFIRTNFAVASDFTRVLPLFHRQLWHFDGIGHDVYLCSLAPSYCFFFSVPHSTGGLGGCTSLAFTAQPHLSSSCRRGNRPQSKHKINTCVYKYHMVTCSR